LILQLLLNDGERRLEGQLPRVIYPVDGGEARFSRSEVTMAGGRHLVWELAPVPDDAALLAVELDLPPGEYLLRCDRVEFPPGGVAFRHTHPGPGIRCLLSGSIRIESGGRSTRYGPFEAWFESGPEPVFAAASETEPSAFVRAMILPTEWEGKRTIAYVDPEDADRPKTQKATVFVEERVTL
jgi:quercetin dioxygenase-like cupin family protein